MVGGVYNNNGLTVTIKSNIFDSNVATSGTAIYAGGGTVTADYNYYYGSGNFVFNTAAGSNSISSTTEPPGLEDPNNGNFHLVEEAPAIDNGDPNSPVNRDFEDDPRPSDQGPDMGADETVGCLVIINEDRSSVYGSIQAAMEIANEGDTLDVSGACSGVHAYDTGDAGGGDCRGTDGIIFVNLHVNKNVTLRGGWNDRFTLRNTPTILDAEQKGRVVYFAPNVEATLDGFQIIQGSLTGTDANGAGICIDNASPNIFNNEIYSNTTTGDGGGIYSINGAATIDRGNRVYSNTAVNGAGIAIEAAGIITVVNNFIYKNEATANGGGLYNNSGNNRLWQNTIVENTAATGGAIYVNTQNPDIRGNLIINNSATSTDGVFGANGTSNPVLNYNNFFPGTATHVGGSANRGATTYDENPEFATAGYTITYDSPIVGLSDPTINLTHDFEDHIRPSHQGVDIGADEVGGCYARNSADPGTIYGSLQLAVDLAADGDLIQVDGECLGVNTRNNDTTDVTQNLYISKTLTIDGNSWNVDSNSPLTATLDARAAGRVVYVHANATLTLTSIILKNGDAVGAGNSDNGGGVFNDGTLVLDQVYLEENNGTNGGGIYNANRLHVHASLIGPNNSAVNGGGLYNNTTVNGTYAEIRDETRIFANSANDGAAIYQNDGTFMLDGNRIYNNLSQQNGTIYLSNNATDSNDVHNNFIYDNIVVDGRGAGVYNDTTTNIWAQHLPPKQG